MNFKSITFNVRIDRACYPHLLSHMRDLRVTDEQVAGLTGQVYLPAPSLLVHQYATSDTRAGPGAAASHRRFQPPAQRRRRGPRAGLSGLHAPGA